MIDKPEQPTTDVLPPKQVAKIDYSHRWWEDLQGVACGTLIVALGILFFQAAGLVTGGVTGFALILHYLTHQPFAWLLLVVNIPFYILAWRQMGKAFTLKTIASVGLLSLWTVWLPRWIQIESHQPWFISILAGILVGTGLLILFRHQASLGGIGILAVYLQKNKGWRAGYVQLVFDFLIVVFALFVRSPQLVLISVLGAVVLNIILVVNHKPGRYVAM